MLGSLADSYCTRSIQPSPMYIRIGRPGLLHETHDFADGAAACRRDESEAPSAERFERDRVVHVRRVRRDAHELLIEQRHTLDF